MNFTILTLGCKVNSYESDLMREKMEKDGYKWDTLNDKTDIVIINTCSVTNQSDAKSRHLIRQSRKLCPNALIIAVGCSCQNHKEAMLDIGANIVLGTKDKSAVTKYIKDYFANKENKTQIYDMSDVEFEPMYLSYENDKTRAFVKIQDGCNNFCSYCIIPYLRGNIRNKDFAVAVNEINHLVESGHKEIVLTGIHTGSYGYGEDYDLVDLIREISKNPNLLRVRISSIEITELGDKFLEELANNPKICDHLHIPLQSGSDLVLSKMNRKYDTAYFAKKIADIKKIRPNISITTDLIVGFPYETDEEFNNTYKFIEKIKFTKVHTFPFSLRSGTKAEEMKDGFVDEKVKKERVHQILELSNKLENDYYNKFLNATLQVIVESEKDGKSSGHTSNYILVHLDKQVLSGKVVNANICKVDNLIVNGTVVDIDN